MFAAHALFHLSETAVGLRLGVLHTAVRLLYTFIRGRLGTLGAFHRVLKTYSEGAVLEPRGLYGERAGAGSMAILIVHFALDLLVDQMGRMTQTRDFRLESGQTRLRLGV
ncbi:hypothetical protein CspHIS471_0703210 [Cutaneotrichosporon sp. HIS471]|nr:hypothetical protein CspHIS471_0703210 [Cutaneotrichosporon sp. HIS471]